MTLDMLSIRFLITCFEVVCAILFYFVFLIKKDIEWGVASLGNCFLISVSIMAMSVYGANWMWAY